MWLESTRDMSGLETAAIKPPRSGTGSTIDQLAAGGEVVWRGCDGTEWRHNDQLGSTRELFCIAHELAGDKQVQRMQGHGKRAVRQVIEST